MQPVSSKDEHDEDTVRIPEFLSVLNDARLSLKPTSAEFKDQLEQSIHQAIDVLKLSIERA